VSARVLFALLLASPLFAQAQADPQAKRQAQKYLDQGLVLFDAGDAHGALDNFLEAYRLYPSPKLLVNIAAAYRRLDRPVEAVEAYEKFIREARADVPAERLAAASKAVREIDAELGRIAVSAPAGTSVAIDGQPKGALPLGALRAKPGRRRVTLSPADAREVEVWVEVTAGGTHAARVEDGAPVVADVPEPAPVAEVAPAAEVVYAAHSHRGRLGAVLRADIEGSGEGGVANVGATYGLAERVEVEIAALIGENFGVRPGAALFVLTGRFKPVVYAGAPIFFTDDGAKAGFHGGAGLLWDPAERWGVFAGLGVAHHPGVPAPLDKTVLLPSVGVQGRL
jgi:hypothetical protein